MGNDRKEDMSAELADVLAWLMSISNRFGIDLGSASYGKYGKGCPKCNHIPCDCQPERM